MGYVWLAEYCECYHETGYVTVSVHATEDGADLGVAAHRERLRLDQVQDIGFMEYRRPAYALTMNIGFEDWTEWRTRLMEVK